MVRAEVLKYRHAQLVENNDASVVVKIPGDPKGDAKNGGLAYGTHFFYKNQLHTFELEE